MNAPLPADYFYIGVDDHDIDLFEAQYTVPEGMCYNSYLVKDRETVVFDSVDARFGEEWLANIKKALGDAAPDYLVVQHMEPDHSANIARFMDAYPTAKVVASAAAFTMMQNFFGTSWADRRIAVKDGDTLSTGAHTFTFLTAPMVHWPEVIMTYDAATSTLFSADAFGKFGTRGADPDDWACEARRYYFGIVGKFGPQVQAVLKKAGAHEIKLICPLHGPTLENADAAKALALYTTWSAYGVETEGVVVAYTSVYGHTQAAALEFAEMLKARGCPKVAVTDLVRDDQAEAVEDAFRYGKIVLASTTYAGGVFPAMRVFLETLAEHNFQNRKIGFIENGSWAPAAAKAMKAILEPCKNTTFTETTVTVRGAMTDATREQLSKLADEILAS